MFQQRGQRFDKDKPQFQQRPPFKPTLAPIREPNRQPEQEDIELLFATVVKGDISEIINLFTNKNIVPTIQNKDGETVLHVILGNKLANLTEEERYNIVDFLIQKGANVAAYNKNNITPLHLAAKYQYTDIVKLLLENGADPNAEDNQYMTPIHYAVQGDIEECKPIKKVGSIVPKKSVKKIPKKEMTDLATTIIELMYEPVFSKFINHIKNSLGIINEIYQKEFDDMKQNLINDIGKILADTTVSDDEKTRRIREKAKTTTENIKNFIEGKLKETKTKIDIKPGIVDGWGPDNDINNQILPPKGDPYKEIPIIKNKEADLMNQIREKINQNAQKLQTECTNFFGIIENMYNDLNHIFYHNANLEINGTYYQNKIKNNNDKMHIDWIELIDTIKGDYSTNLIPPEMNLVGTIKLKALKAWDVAENNPPLTYRGTNSQVENAQRLKQKPRLLPLTNDQDEINEGNNLSKLDPTEILERNPNYFTENVLTLDYRKLNNSMGVNYGFFNDKYNLISSKRINSTVSNYFIGRLSHSALQTVLYSQIIKNNIELINRSLKENNMYQVYSIVNIIKILLINIINHIIFSLDDKTTTVDKFNNLVQLISNGKRAHLTKPYGFSYDAMMNILKSDPKTKSTDMQAKLNLTYESLQSIYQNSENLFNSLETFITYVNYRNSINWLTAYYYNGTRQKSFSDNTTDTILNIFNRQLSIIGELPGSIDVYRSENGDIYSDQTKANFYKKYIMTVNNYNYGKYLSNIDKFSIVVPIKLMLFDDRRDISDVMGSPKKAENNAIVKQLIEININRPSNSSIGYLLTNQEFFYKIDNQTDKYVTDFTESRYNLITIPYGNETVHPDVLNNTDTQIGNTYKKGYVGIDNPVTLNRETAVFPSISANLDKHMSMLKYLIIQNTILLFSNNRLGTPVSDNDIITVGSLIDQKIDDVKNNLLNDIREKQELKEQLLSGILYALIGKTSDEIIINFIDYSIASSSNNFVYETLVNYGGQTHSTILNSITNRNDVGIFVTDTGFSLNLSNIFRQIVDLYRQEIHTSVDPIRITAKLTEDPNNKPQIYIQNQNYTFGRIITQEQCYKINPEIVSMLIDKGADLNRMDYTRTPPVTYAAETLYDKLVKTLIDKSYVNVNTMKNTSGKTPLESFIELYKLHNQVMYKNNENIAKIYDPVLKNIKKNLESKGEYKYNIIRYLDLVFPMMLVMYNNMFYYFMIGYAFNWQYTDLQNLKTIMMQYKIISPSQIDSGVLPILELNDNEITKLEQKSDDYLVLLDEQNQMQIESRDNTRAYLMYEVQLKQIDQEIRDLERSGNKQIKLDQLKNMRQIIQNKMEMSKGKLHPQLTMLGTNLKTAPTGLKDRLNNFINSYDYRNEINIKNMYNKIFQKVIKTTDNYTGLENLMQYQEMWLMSLKGEKINHLSNLHFMTIIAEEKILNQLDVNNKTSIVKTKGELETLHHLFSNIFEKNIINYQQLPKEYNEQENYMMKNVIDIFTHVTRHILCASMYYTVLKAITAWIMAMTPDELQATSNPFLNPSQILTSTQRRDFIMRLVENIIDFDLQQQNSDPQLAKYMIRDMPLQLVKHVLKMYEDDFDNARNIESVDTLFQPIITILMKNKTVSITKDSTIIKNLNDFIFPYYRDVMTQTIEAMRVVLENYNRYIINESRYSGISVMLLNKAGNEF